MDDRRFFPDEAPFLGISIFRPDGSIKFDPILCDQRYSFVVSLLGNSHWRERITTVADFGCSDLSFYRVLRSLRFLTNVYLVDIDEDLLRNNRHRAQPITNDFIQKRDNRFRVEVLRGSVDYFCDKMNSLDAFVAIELIEHLYPEELERLPYNIFHLIMPQIAIFTTPNSDFNILFASLPAQKFRHDDHKFEWSREQFREWADNLTERFPDYSVSVQGIGPPPKGAEEYGCCSQAAVFVRRPNSTVEVNPLEIQEYNDGAKIQTYDIITECDYPFDERSREQKICDSVMYQINRMEHRGRMDRKEDYDSFRLEIPLGRLVEEVSGEVSTTVEELEGLLKEKNVQIEDGSVIVVSDDEDYDCEEEFQDYEDYD